MRLEFYLYLRLAMNVVWGALLASDHIANRTGSVIFDGVAIIVCNAVFLIVWKSVKDLA